MPPKQSVRANDERPPALTAQQSAGRGREHPVGLLQPRPRDLSAQNRQLVSAHHDLKLLELTRAQPRRRHRERTSKQQIDQRDQQKALQQIASGKRDPTTAGATDPHPVDPWRIYVPDRAGRSW
jgi:hypothetical protein